METQTLAAGDSRRQSASLLLLKINHMLITVQSNGVNFPTNLRYNIHHSDLRILRQTEWLLQIVPDSLRFLTIPYGYMETGQPGDCRRSTQIVADSRRHSYDYMETRLYDSLRLYGNRSTWRLPAIDADSRRQSPALLRLYGNQA